MRRHLIDNLQLVIWLLLISSDFFSFSAYGNIVPVTAKNGLDSNTVYDIYYGTNGFVWFATDMGVSRYDGYRMRNYPLISYSDAQSGIPVPKAVTRIVQGFGNLYFLQLLHGGVACFNSRIEAYIPVSFEQPLNRRDILSFYITDDQKCYVGTLAGLYAAELELSGEDAAAGVVVHLADQPLVKGKVTALTGSGKGWLFACIDRTKVVAYNINSGKPEVLKRGIDSEITRLYLHNNYLWICSVDSGIELYNIEQRSLHQIHVAGEDEKVFKDSYVTDVVSVDNSTFYVSTWEGLLKLTFDSEELAEAKCKLEWQEPQSSVKMEKRITKLLWNEEQCMLWLGTFGKGVAKMYCAENMLNSLGQSFGANVIGIEEDLKGYIWVLTDKGKLWRSTSNRLTAKTSFEPWKEGLKAGETYRMNKDRYGRLWLGDTHGGVVCINTQTEKVSTAYLQPKDAELFSGSVKQFCLDSRDRLWVITGSGLFVFDDKAMEAKPVSLKYEGEKIKIISSIAEDKEGNLWLGTDLGLKRLEIQGSTFELYGKYEKDAGLEVSPVYFVYVNNYNQILAAYSDKMLRIDGRKKDRIENVFTLLNGMCSSHILCMVDDANGNTWVGSNSGIMTLRNDQTLLFNYDWFGFSNSVCCLRDGRLLWSGSMGLTFFDPLMVKTKQSKGNLQLAELWINGKIVSAGESVKGQVVLKSAPDLQDSFVFGAGNGDFTFYFSDLEYGIMHRRLAYRLLPGGDWKTAAPENGVSFSQLAAGNYILQVKLIYADATSSETKEMPILVKSYWWNTIWAILGYVLAICGVVWIIINNMKSKKARQHTHKTREMELKETLNLTKMKQEQEREMDAMRNRLLTKFMEELRTPLSLIIAPLKEMSQEQNLPAGLLSKLRVAYRSSLGMLDACNQLLDIYIQGSLADRLVVAPCTVDRLVDELVFTVSELVRINQIDFKCERKIKKNMEVWVDRKRIRFVLHNLLSNAFHHVAFSGDVSLILQEIVRDGVTYCMITVEDNGKSEVKEVVQLMDERMLSGLTAVELGYDVMEKIIQLHHGTINMKSVKGKGTEVVVEIPVGKEIFENDANVLFSDVTTEEETVEANPIVEEFSQKVPLPEERPVQNQELSAEPAEKKTLLIVEDHKDIRLYLKVLFGKDYNLLIATNGQEGIDMAVKGQPDLVLCDVMMPIKDGFECCRELKTGLETCHIPIIMLTAKVEDDDILKGLELGADDYILKPFTPSILKAKVRNLINGRLQLKQMYTNLLIMPDNGNADTTEADENVKMEDPFISSVVKIIEDNICEPDFNVKKLASDLNMSQPTLYRKVKQSTDFTIIELIRGVRMRKAAVLLKKKIYAVQEVAEMVGYNDIPTFRKHFVDTFGTTPSTYAGAENT